MKSFKYIRVLLLIFILSLNCQEQERYKIGLLIVATGNYTQFVSPLIESAQKYFLTNHDITYFVFTDGYIPAQPYIIQLEHKRLGWPFDTMMRCFAYYRYQDQLRSMDYLFATDADMLFVDYVGDEILSDRVATQHPGYIGKRGTYETRHKSKAYVASHEGKYYFAGGFYGGKTEEFLKMTATMVCNITEDKSKGIIAVWHDESHLNRYFISNPPTKILNPSYCMPEDMSKAYEWGIAHYPRKLLALEKDHGNVRK